MKRDMELVRIILLDLEKDRSPFKWKQLNIGGYDVNKVSHHLKIMNEANLVEAKQLVSTKDRDIWAVKSLTWYGHEFLDSIKNDTIWNKTKEGVKQKGFDLGNIPFDVLKEYAKLQLKQLFGIE